jgi:hypothetical protein
LYEKNDEVDQVSNFTLIAYYPVNFDDVVKKEDWVEDMNEEIDATERNNTWELLDFPEDKNCIGFKMIYKTMLNVEDEVDRHKERLVSQRFSQPNIDYNETFAPVASLDRVTMVLAIVAHNKWCMYQMDVKYAFLNGFMKEEVYVKQPPRYEIDGQEGKIYRLKKTLYGLKQEPTVWYNRIDE